MANCPNCGSSHIQLKRETNVSWGRAVAGWALFGVVGGAVGAMTGEDRNVNACLDCGATWKAADLHKIRVIIQRLALRKLDLAIEEDRVYLNNFMTEVGPYIDSMSKAEERANLMIKNAERETGAMTESGFSYGCTTFFFMFTGGLSAGASAGIIIFLSVVATLIAYALGAAQDSQNISAIPGKMQVALKEAEKIRRRAEIDFEYRVKDFVARHP